MSDNNKANQYLDKHKRLDDVQGALKDAHDARGKYQQDISDTETYLTAFFNREDPLIDPATDKPIAWIRQLTIRELRDLTPEIIREAVGKSKEELQTLVKEHPELEDYSYHMMAAMITKPKKTAEEWKAITTPDFANLFDARVEEILQRTAEKVDFF